MQLEPWKNCGNSVVVDFELGLLDLLPQHLADSRVSNLHAVLNTRLISFLFISITNLKKAKDSIKG